MSNNAHDKTAQEEHFADIFARLREQDIEQFYAHYQLWVLRRRLPLIENQLEALREHLAENQQVTESMRPSALALAVLVRLQSNGVNNTDVLDLMLDRGEDWLDRMMQRLDYCEQVEDFIQGDYNQWCIKSLEGAYDWIDSLLGSLKEGSGHGESPAHDGEETEELLLQKLSQDDEEAMLEVMSKQPITPLEVATSDSEIPSAEPLPASELEPVNTSNEQAFAPDIHSEALLIPLSAEAVESQENSEALPTPLSAEAVESQENNELEQQPELLGWKDLEDLEAPGEEPVPWYSIDVTEDGATSISNRDRQAVTMNDWITILHADTRASSEASTTAATSSNAAEPLSTTNPAETAETYVPTPTPTSEVTISPSANHAEAVEVQHEPEVLSPVTLTQKQPIPASEELQNDAISNDKSQLAQVEAGQATSENAHDLEELEQASGKQETDPLKHAKEAQALAKETAPATDEADSHEGQQLFTADLTPTETETAEAQPFAAELTHTEVEDAEIQSFAADLTHIEVEDAEMADAQPSVADLATSENVPAELSEVQVTSAETTEAALTGDGHTEIPQPQEQDILLSSNTPGEQPDRYKDNDAQKPEKEAQSHEIETAAIANDILSGEEEQDEQLPWYEYLDLEELANNAGNSADAKRVEAGKAEDISPAMLTVNETTSPETSEYAGVEAQENGQDPLLRSENSMTEEMIEGENWQSGNASPGEEETLPLALKEIQQAQYPPIDTRSNAPESSTNEAIEPRDNSEDAATEIHPPASRTEASDTVAPTALPERATNSVVEEANREASSAEAQMAHPEVETSTLAKEVSPKSEEHTTSKTADIAEQPTLMMEKIPQMPRGSVTSGVPAESARVDQTVHRENTPVSTSFTSTEKAEKPPKKLGFWRRLFSFGRKKQ